MNTVCDKDLVQNLLDHAAIHDSEYKMYGEAELRKWADSLYTAAGLVYLMGGEDVQNQD